jgi:hypothetical protein
MNWIKRLFSKIPKPIYGFMKVSGEYVLKLNITMDNGYVIPYNLLNKFFSEYTLDSIHEQYTIKPKGVMVSTIKSGRSGTCTINYLFKNTQPKYDYEPIFRHYCNKGYLKFISTSHLYYYEVLIDMDIFTEEFEELTTLYKDVKNNYTTYERECVIDIVLDI